MYCKVGYFSPRSGTGSQTVTGVVDGATGLSFIPTFILFQSGYAAANTLVSGGIPTNAWCDFRGADNSVKSSSRAGAEVAAAGFKDTGLGESIGGWSIIDYNAQPAFGGVILRLAKVTAFRLGEFDIQFDQNDRTGDIIQYTAFGGSDLTIETPNSDLNGTHTFSNPPQGLITLPIPALNPGSSAATATGSQSSNWGFAAKDSEQGSASVHVSLQGSNYRYQRTDSYAADLLAPTNLPSVSFSGNSYVISGNTSGAFFNSIVFTGANIKATSGVITQPLVTGSYRFNCGIYAKWLYFLSVGNVASTSVDTPVMQMLRGWTDGSSQLNYWGGETTPGGFTTPLNGVRYLSITDIIRFASANALSTSFNTVAELDTIHPNGLIDLNFLSVNGDANQILWFALGEQAQSDNVNVGKGIYKLVPEKKQDTIWYDYITQDEILKKIPNPTAWTSLIGDE